MLTELQLNTIIERLGNVGTTLHEQDGIRVVLSKDCKVVGKLNFDLYGNDEWIAGKWTSSEDKVRTYKLYTQIFKLFQRFPSTLKTLADIAVS